MKSEIIIVASDFWETAPSLLLLHSIKLNHIKTMSNTHEHIRNSGASQRDGVINLFEQTFATKFSIV